LGLAASVFYFYHCVALVFSVGKRQSLGESWNKTFIHILKRCVVLFLLGLTLTSYELGILSWKTQNVLIAFSLSTLFCFLFFKFSIYVQLSISLLLILVYDLFYMLWSAQGYDQPYVHGHDLGAHIDMLLMGRLDRGGWNSVSFIPAIAHMLWGNIVGKILISQQTPFKKYKTIVIAASVLLATGYLLYALGIPFNKHIYTSSYTFAAGGYCLLALGLLYWFVDIKEKKRLVPFFMGFGMNSIFIYVFCLTIAMDGLKPILGLYTNRIMVWFAISPDIMTVFLSAAIVGVEWLLCYYLYKKKIIIKI
jgi:predicted acyltransferase